MHKFVNGPAKLIVLSCRRAPLFLRVVHDTEYAQAVCKKDRQEWDALDELGDKPLPQEKLYCYILDQDHGTVHYDGRDKKGKRFGRTEVMADYRYFEPQPADEIMRDTDQWRSWCLDTANELGIKGKMPANGD